MRALINTIAWLWVWWRARCVARWERTRFRAWVASQLYAGRTVERVYLRQVKNGRIVRVK